MISNCYAAITNGASYSCITIICLRKFLRQALLFLPNECGTFGYIMKSIEYKIILFSLLICLVLGSGCSGFAPQKSTPMIRVGLLSGIDTFNIATDGFRAGMADLGYIENENISYEFHSADGDREKMKEIANRYVADGVDLIFTTSTGAANIAKAATAESQTPVVFTIVSDPVGSGVVNDLRQPGGNITGATRSLAGLMSKRVEFLHEIHPDLRGIWVPHEADYANAATTLMAVHTVADPLNIPVIETPVYSQDEFIAELERLSSLDVLEFDAIKVPPDPTIQSKESITALMAFAQKYNIAVVANNPGQVRDGALLTYSDDPYQSGQLAATIADKILQGTETGTIPVAFVEPNLYLNYKTALHLGFEIDESLLAQAEEIIQ